MVLMYVFSWESEQCRILNILAGVHFVQAQLTSTDDIASTYITELSYICHIFTCSYLCITGQALNLWRFNNMSYSFYTPPYTNSAFWTKDAPRNFLEKWSWDRPIRCRSLKVISAEEVKEPRVQREGCREPRGWQMGCWIFSVHPVNERAGKEHVWLLVMLTLIRSLRWCLSGPLTVKLSLLPFF